MQLTRQHLVELGLTTNDKAVYEQYPIRVMADDRTDPNTGLAVTHFTWHAAGRYVDPSPQTLEEACALLNKRHPLLENQDAIVVPSNDHTPGNELDPGLSLDGGGEGS
jgi:hypothetical protein